MRPFTPNRRAAASRGYSIIVALIVLVALSLLASSAIKSSTMNLKVVGNTQYRQEALASAQAALEATISSQTFARDPAGVASVPIAVDIDGDGVTDYSARLSPPPACYTYKTVQTVELNPESSDDVPCLRSVRTETGIETAVGLTNTDSLCANSEWNLRAAVSDPQTGTSVAVNQGVAIRGLITDAANSCF